jgi:hypothetical protein
MRRIRELEKMTAPQAWPRLGFDVAPVWQMYIDSMENWKRSYESLGQSASGNQGSLSHERVAAHDNAPALDWQKSAEELLRRFVAQQIDLCRFFGHRWEQYLRLSGQVARCRSASELGQIQTAFLSQLATDYANESAKLMQPFGMALPNWLANRHY